MNMHIPRTPVFVTSLDTTNTRTDTHALGSVPGKRRRSAARSERSCTAARTGTDGGGGKAKTC